MLAIDANRTSTDDPTLSVSHKKIGQIPVSSIDPRSKTIIHFVDEPQPVLVSETSRPRHAANPVAYRIVVQRPNQCLVTLVHCLILSCSNARYSASCYRITSRRKHHRSHLDSMLSSISRSALLFPLKTSSIPAASSSAPMVIYRDLIFTQTLLTPGSL